MVDIIIVASNSIVRHPRIWKIVTSLRKRYSTVVLGWNREGISSEETSKYLVDLTVLNVGAPFGRPSLILYYPLFWIWILLKLMKYKPKVVHAVDLDTLIPCLIFKLIFRKKLLYDVHDRFSGYVPPKYTILYKVIDLVEELLSKQSSVMVTVSEIVLNTFRLKPKHCAVIMNLSEDYNLEKSKSEDGILTLVYTGLILKDKGLEVVTSAIGGLNGVRLLLAGRAADRELLNHMLKLPNIRYVGFLPERSDLLKLEANSDVMIVLYDLKYRKNQLGSPNKTFEAMMCGIPLVTNMEQELVRKIGCGIIVDYNNTNQIKEAIILLRDNEKLRITMGHNGRKAFEEKYNWNRMEQKLYEIYNNLMKK